MQVSDFITQVQGWRFLITTPKCKTRLLRKLELVNLKTGKIANQTSSIADADKKRDKFEA